MEKIKVLIADDHLLAREGLCQILEGAGDIECIATAKNGEEAVQLAKEISPDVAIIDVAMPLMNGIEATKKIKAACPETAVLIVSAYDYEHYVLACIELGASGYLLKDKMFASRLVNAIHTVHMGESIFDGKAHQVIRELTAKKQRHETGSGVLSRREFEVLQLLIQGKTNKEIASELCLSTQTVGSHLSNIFRKLGVQSRMEAVLYAINKGWGRLDDASHIQEQSRLNGPSEEED